VGNVAMKCLYYKTTCFGRNFVIIDVTSLEINKTGIIKEIKGGKNHIHKLESMGIRIGKKINKISGFTSKGPQIIKIDNIQIALGHGIAKHIIVET
jgi:Fe2+ transport system protein FeoA